MERMAMTAGIENANVGENLVYKISATGTDISFAGAEKHGSFRRLAFGVQVYTNDPAGIDSG